MLVLPALAGCGSVPPSPPAEPEETVLPPARDTFVIGSGNILEITVFGEPELSLPARVTESGFISYPLLGEVKVAGYTPMELERRLEALLGRDYLVSPRVTVFVREYGTISVLGQVKKPGAYQYRELLSVTEAIALGGGLTDIAKPNSTQIIRNDPETGKTVIRVRMADILEKDEGEKDILLKPGDIVFVPESFF